MHKVPTNLLSLRMAALSLGLVAAFACVARAQTSMTIDSFDGPVTANEINSFKSYITALTPAANNIGNQWAQHDSGEDVKAMALVYQITQDTAVLDQMVRFCDALLSERNDLAPSPTGQIVIWTGRIDPIWPNTTTTPIGTGGEQGDPVGHLGNCARLILQTPSIWNTTVPIGDPDGYGATYLLRAKTYVAGGDAAISGHILKSELDLSNSDHQYFASGDPYKGGLPVPWNQQMMFDYGFQNLAIAHDILGDNPTLAAQYHQIVQDSINWFFSSGYTSYTDNAGNTAYSWGYTMPNLTKEDNDHGSLDVNGFYRAYMSGEYGITPAMLAPFGNTFNDVMTLGPGDYSGVIDGTTGSGNSASTTYIRSGWLLTADFLPSQYETMMGADFSAPGTTTKIDLFSRFLWLKNKRYQSFTFAASPSSQTAGQGSSTSYIATVTAQGAFAGTVALSVTGLPSGATASFSPTTISGGGDSTMTVQTASSTPTGTYPLTILANSMGTVAQTASVNLTVSAGTPPVPPGFSISANPTALSISAGATGSAAILVTPTGGFNGPISFTCSGLPVDATCSFSPTTVTPGSSGTTASTTVTIATDVAVAAMQPPARPLRSPAGSGETALAFLGLGLLGGIRGRRRFARRFGAGLWNQVLACCLLLGSAAMMALAGCGGSGGSTNNTGNSPKTPPGTSTIVVTATSGSLKSTANIQVTVH